MRVSALLCRVACGMLLLTLAGSGAAMAAEVDAASAAEAKQILDTSGVTGGLIVHVGCGDGKLTAALAGERFNALGLDADAKDVNAARDRINALGAYGRVTIDHLHGRSIPLIDNLVNLVVVSDADAVSMEEVTRVLAPNGVAMVRSGDTWNKTVKPRPSNIDDWTHYLHDPTNNAVAHDEVVGPPRRLQWVSGPRYSRHHDKMSSLSAMVSANGRVFTIFDEAPRVSVLLPPEWKLIARDAFNGTILWKRDIDDWQPNLWGLKNGPAQLPRRLVAVGDRVYVTMTIDGPITAIDAATGETVLTYKGTENTAEILVDDGVVYSVMRLSDPGAEALAKRRGVAWTEKDVWALIALDAATGKPLWEDKKKVLPNTLAVSGPYAVFHDGESVVCLKRDTGEVAWRSEPVARSAEMRPFFSPTLVIYKDVVLFAGGEKAGSGSGGWSRDVDSMSALDLATGKVLWNAPHPASGYRSAEDLMVVDGLVWTGETTSGRAEGLFTGRDPRTGEVKRSFEPDVQTYWFHHRCYRGKATDKYLMMSRTGIEYIDVKKESWDTNHFVRGACLYGVMPANGLTYAPQHPCACYLEAKLSGFNALAPAADKPLVPVADDKRLTRGPGYDLDDPRVSSVEEWPTFRHDNERSGHASTIVPTSLQTTWKTPIGGKLTAPVVADHKVFVASIDTHTVHAIDADTGKPLWSFTSGGRVDSPPTYHKGRVYFGSNDGYVYALRASDGALAWRFLAAFVDQRTMSFDQIESLWPVNGSVLIENDVLYCVAGRSMFLDGGIRMYRLDPATGGLLSITKMDDREEGTGKKITDFVSWLNMPVGLPDVLSCDDRFVYMRSQPFDLSGKRLPLSAMPRKADADQGAPDPVQGVEHAHIFSPTGYLDDSYWHRTYWMYGTMYVSGWQGYYRAGKSAPAGRVLVSDDTTIYGFGRKPEYWKWTTPMENHLFSSPRKGASQDVPDNGGVSNPAVRRGETPVNKNAGKGNGKGGDGKGNAGKGDATGSTVVRLANAPKLSTAKSPVTVEAWIKPASADGVILARGGGAMGFTLYLDDAHPVFALRNGGKITDATAKHTVDENKWVHLAGVLDGDGTLKVYIDGKLAASARADGPLPKDPIEGVSIGTDDETPVGEYKRAVGFTGLIDDVRIYRKARSEAQIAADAAAPADADAKPDADGLVVAFGFDDGKATDASGNQLNGAVDGASTAPGRAGKALRFDGRASETEVAAGEGSPNTEPEKAVPGFDVPYDWTTDIPMFVRGLVLSEGNLFMSGPEDAVNEEQAFRKLSDLVTQKQIKEEGDAWAGKSGALFWVVNAKTGQRLFESRLDTPPVFNGMAAANRKLYVSGVDGSITCLDAK
ncbi:MAG: PQQ-binding-like beta-propeller repeat protein [Phycisphaera sp.]|nr:PQQ-binding-like beta-propeller repeat protein [Phycisphaera sp.]